MVLTPVSRSWKPSCLRSGPTWDRSKATTERLRIASTLSIGHCLPRREPVIGDSPQDSSSLTCGIPKVVTARLGKAEFAGLRARATTRSRPPLRCWRTRPAQLGDAPWRHPDRDGAARGGRYMVPLARHLGSRTAEDGAGRRALDPPTWIG